MKEEPYNQDNLESFIAAENDFFATIRHDKDQVWERIEDRLEKKKAVPFWYYSVAASFLIFVSIGIIFFQQIKEKNRQIEKLQVQLYINKNKQIEAEIPVDKTEKQLNSLEVKQEKIIYRNLIITDTIVLHDTITNKIIEKDTVYVQDNKALYIANIAIKEEGQLYEKNYAASNQKNPAKKKTRRFIFKFGKHDSETTGFETASNEESGLITLRSK
jgi:hypothetical protein